MLRRGIIFSLYNNYLGKSSHYFVPEIPKFLKPYYHQFVICLNSSLFSIKNVIIAFQAYGVKVFPDFYPNYKRVFYNKSLLSNKKFPVSAKIMNQRIILPFYPFIKKEEIKYIFDTCNVIKKEQNFSCYKKFLKKI